MHESLDEFQFRPDTATNSRVICPCVSEKLMYNVVNTLAPLFLAHLSRRLIGELIGYSWSGVRPSVVHIFKLQYLRNQWSNSNQILSEASFGRGKGCIRFDRIFFIFSSPEPKAQGELIVYQSSRGLCVWLCVCLAVCL